MLYEYVAYCYGLYYVSHILDLSTPIELYVDEHPDISYIVRFWKFDIVV